MYMFNLTRACTRKLPNIIDDECRAYGKSRRVPNKVQRNADLASQSLLPTMKANYALDPQQGPGAQQVVAILQCRAPSASKAC
jgi:hypothetical protein